jgi:hypothetical protein
MIQYQLKLRLNTKQEATLSEWLFMLTGVWNWAIRKIELDAANKIYFTPKDFQNLLANHGEKMGIPSHTLQVPAGERSEGKVKVELFNSNECVGSCTGLVQFSERYTRVQGLTPMSSRPIRAEIASVYAGFRAVFANW